MLNRLILFSGLLLIGCTTSSKLPVTYSTSDPVQAYVDANSSQATAVAAIATADYYTGQLTATIEAQNATATERAWSIQSTAQAADITSTARVWEATVTADSAKATSTAADLATARSIQATETQRALDITSTADYAVAQAFATQQYSKAKQAELEIKRRELTNNISALFPWISIIIGVGTALAIFFYSLRIKVIPRDQRGDAPLLFDLIDGVVIEPDRHPTSTAGVRRGDLKQLPKLSEDAYLQTTARDQMIDLATRNSPAGNDARQRRAVIDQINNSNLLGSVSDPEIKIIDRKDALPLYGDVIRNIVQDSIEAELISDDEGE